MPDAPNDPPPIDGLLAAVRAGDERAAGAFVRRYEPMLRRALRVTGKIRWLQSELESQDLVQSVFIQVIAAIRGEGVQFRDEAGLEGYLRTVGRNRLRDHIRRLKAARRDRQRILPGGAEALARLAGAEPSPSGVAEVREQVARVEGCTPPADLEVLRGRADGADWQELAAARNTTPEALRKRIERVRQRIRETLAE
jgi:RNA polymerase sigma factor (sigma-70 family)